MFFVGVRIHLLFWKSAGNAASTPAFSVPAMGWPAMKWIVSGRIFPISSTMFFLTLPTSVTIAPFLRDGSASFITLAILATGMAATTRSQSFTPSFTS